MHTEASAVLVLLSLFEWRIQTTATYWNRHFFPLTQVQNVCASWPLAVVFAVCLNTIFYPRRIWYFIAASSLFSVWCVTVSLDTELTRHITAHHINLSNAFFFIESIISLLWCYSLEQDMGSRHHICTEESLSLLSMYAEIVQGD